MITPPRLLFEPDSPVPSPCFVLDLERLRANAAILAGVQDRTGAKILLALKAFSAFDVFPILSRSMDGPLFGTCASSVDEARLGREYFDGEVHAFAAAWDEKEIEELTHLADHIVFNSLGQWRRHRTAIEAANATFRSQTPIQCGLRLNPEHSEGAADIYNPCAPGSRLGIRAKALADVDMRKIAGISGLHFHTLCEQNAAPLARTLAAFERKFLPFIKGRQWLNFGGGHHITREGYDLALLEKLIIDWRRRWNCEIYLEPGEAVALNAGWLTATVLDIVEADMPVAILDASAACHMPDVLEMPYRPDFWRLEGNDIVKADGPDIADCKVRLAGKSCLAGDVIGEYSLKKPLQIGERIIFGDMAIYSMVKTNTFNGLRLPAIGACDGASFRMIRQFGYEDFLHRLS